MMKTKSSVDRALEAFAKMAEADREYIPALLGMSLCFVMQKQTVKARNQLRRISKSEKYDVEWAEEFEQAWLLLADTYVQTGKYDLAMELCKRCLTHNKSCSKACEMLGGIMEKEQSYADAADKYEHAWKLSHEASAPIGFKLAFNYLKAERFTDAIDICHKVLTSFPNYPSIRENILDKAREGIR